MAIVPKCDNCEKLFDDWCECELQRQQATAVCRYLRGEIEQLEGVLKRIKNVAPAGMVDWAERSTTDVKHDESPDPIAAELDEMLEQPDDAQPEPAPIHCTKCHSDFRVFDETLRRWCYECQTYFHLVQPVNNVPHPFERENYIDVMDKHLNKVGERFAEIEHLKIDRKIMGDEQPTCPHCDEAIAAHDDGWYCATCRTAVEVV